MRGKIIFFERDLGAKIKLNTHTRDSGYSPSCIKRSFILRKIHMNGNLQCAKCGFFPAMRL